MRLWGFFSTRLKLQQSELVGLERKKVAFSSEPKRPAVEPNPKGFFWHETPGRFQSVEAPAEPQRVVLKHLKGIGIYGTRNPIHLALEGLYGIMIRFFFLVFFLPSPRE